MTAFLKNVDHALRRWLFWRREARELWVGIPGMLARVQAMEAKLARQEELLVRSMGVIHPIYGELRRAIWDEIPDRPWLER